MSIITQRVPYYAMVSFELNQWLENEKPRAQALGFQRLFRNLQHICYNLLKLDLFFLIKYNDNRIFNSLFSQLSLSPTQYNSILICHSVVVIFNRFSSAIVCIEMTL